MVLTIAFQQRNPKIKVSWLFLMTILPIFSVAIFFTLGKIKPNKNELKVMREDNYNLNKINQIEKTSSASVELNELKNITDTTILNSNYHFYEEGYRFYDSLEKNIKEAKKSILIITYIIKKSEISKEFIDLIKLKAKEGLEIKWLIDDFGAFPRLKKELKKLNKIGVKVHFIAKIYYPFITHKAFYRNHQKFIIIDSKKVFSGGNNISDEYASLSPKYGHWIDINYKITGEYVNAYNVHFIKFWEIITREKLDVNNYISKFKEDEKGENQSILVFDSPSWDYSNAERVWIKLFSQAKKSIKIATPYFSITEAMYKQIILALKNNVDVTIFFPGLPDKKLVYKVGLWQIKQLVQLGMKVQIYDNHFLHSKSGIIDDKIAWVGTSNLDARSMFSQYETMDIIVGPAIKNVIHLFEQYNNNSTDIRKNPELMKKGTIFERFFYIWTSPTI
ncbi:phosphatidylserine/phosphatidylglycerophosphate/cardiolipin synthase family protein [Mycoplasma sp. OR1901]|uniref:phospholipase D-like domain-containing protein n=1 Tax=Mycoplasma sp. OR1901 TaxID=2742195 RepID=UPI0015843D91|nr:phosphatidylserine/phosphatidylglycerophosphate/cardiolipin synthase family protein [Mycoplasma sp. OR1901]QKT05336.1 phosphatidylserine/phosphatidylglycerophosphate/cardiolipin synthase family protein [Mycoplasma sp. OR1901]